MAYQTGVARQFAQQFTRADTSSKEGHSTGQVGDLKYA